MALFLSFKNGHFHHHRSFQSHFLPVDQMPLDFYTCPSHLTPTSTFPSAISHQLYSIQPALLHSFPANVLTAQAYAFVFQSWIWTWAWKVPTSLLPVPDLLTFCAPLGFTFCGLPSCFLTITFSLSDLLAWSVFQCIWAILSLLVCPNPPVISESA